ncbi:MAG: hypothetical protein N2643_00655 [Endomicrobia bacterium]|nr:hypothetical protein [Endomicrobiia bacterium]
MKKNIIFALYIAATSWSLCVTLNYTTLTGFTKEVGSVYINPTSIGLIDKVSFEIFYVSLLKDVIDENFYNTRISAGFNFKKLFFGLGYSNLSLEDIYSEEIYLFNLGTKIFNNRLYLASNLKYFGFKYTFDEYYENDPLLQQQLVKYSYDFGISYNFFDKVFLSLSCINILSDKSFYSLVGYSIMEAYILSCSYRYFNSSNLVLEFYINNVKSKEISDSFINYKIGIVQQILQTKLLNFSITSAYNRTDNTDRFLIAFRADLLSRSMGIKYMWDYPVTGITNFFGNHSFLVDFSFGKNTKYKEEENERNKVLLEEKKISVEKQSFKTKEKDNKIEPKIAVEVEEHKIKVSTDIVTNIAIENKVMRTTYTVAETEKEQNKLQVLTSTVTLPYVGTDKDIHLQPTRKETPNVIKTTTTNIYKFPLAHKVNEGETLISISKKYYNTEKGWKKIYETNKDKIIKGIPIVGEVLIIPEP